MMISETERNHLSVVFLLATLFFIYPNRTLLFAPDWIIFGFSAASITLIALGLTFLKNGAYWIHPRLLTLPAVILLYLLCRNSRSAAEIFQCAAYLVLPYCAFLFRKELKKALPLLLTLLWCLTLAQSLAERFLFDKDVLGGLPMNKNWNVCLLLGCLPFVLWQLRKRRILLAVLLVPALYVLLHSRTLAIPLILSGEILLFLLIFKKYRILCGCLAAGIAGLCILSQTAMFRNFLETEDRPFFYKSTIQLIAEAPAIGHGLMQFEQTFLPYRTKEYFSLPHAADRVNHPHNHLLYIAAGTGLGGLLLWLLLWLVPAVCSLRRLQRRFNAPDAVILSAWTVFAVHGMVDLVMDQAPTGIIALLLTGLLWGNMPLVKQKKMYWKINKAWGRGAAAIFFAAAGLLMAATELNRSIHFRKAERLLTTGNLPLSRYHYEKATAAQKLYPYFTENWKYYDYQTAVRYCTGNPVEQRFALELLDRFARSSVPDFAHINMIRGRLLLSQGHAGGVSYLIREAELFPLNPYPLLALWNYYIEKRNKNAAETVAAELNQRFSDLKLDAFIPPEQMFPEEWQQAKISGTDGQEILTNPQFNIYQNTGK